MTTLHQVLESHVGDGSTPGAVGLVARGDRVEVQAAGSVDVDGTSPMARDSIFRIASITKPITAAAVMMLVEDGRIALDDPVERWLPELASPIGRPHAGRPGRRRGAGGPADHRAPTCSPSAPATASRPTSRCPRSQPLFSELQQGPPQPQLVPPPDEWMAALARIPLLHQPGEAWLYNTCSDIQGVLIARVAGQPLPEFLAERLFEPLGMADTGVRGTGRQARPVHQLLPGRSPRAVSSWSTPPTGSGAARPRSRPAPAAWSRPPTTGSPSPGCCSPTGRGRPAAARRPSRCGR